MIEDETGEGTEDEEESPIMQALREALASGEAESNPTGWLEEAATREFNRELEDAPNPLARWEELVAEFRAKGNNASLAAQKAARTWAASAPERESLKAAVRAIPDEPPATRSFWRRLRRRV